MADIKQETLAAVKEWKGFLDFLEGFSLDKEIDDKAEQIRELTGKLETSLTSDNNATLIDEAEYTDTRTEDTYTDTRTGDEEYTDTVSPAAQLGPSDAYEIQDFDDVKSKPQKEQAGKIDDNKKTSTKQKKKLTKKSKSDSKDDESYSSGGSFKDINDNIPDVTFDIIGNAKECPISGRLTKRNSDNPSASGLFKSNPKVYAGIYKNIFYWFDKPSGKKQKGAFQIAGYAASIYVNEKQKKKEKQKDFIFEMKCAGKRTFYFSTQTEKPMNQWIDMFNKLAKVAPEADVKEKSEPEVATEPDEDLYEETEPVETEKIEEVEQDDDVYEDPGNVERESDVTKKPTSDVDVTSVPPLPPGRRDVSPHRSDTVTMRDKPKDPKPSVTTPSMVDDDEIYDDGTSAGPPLPPPPKSWVQDDDDDQELYTDAESLDVLKHDSPRSPAETNNNTPLPKFETLFYGLWDCRPSTDKELEFHHGDTIEILERRYDKDGWWVGLLNGRVGLVPKQFLTPVYRQV